MGKKLLVIAVLAIGYNVAFGALMSASNVSVRAVERHFALLAAIQAVR
jgi:hypothetical protein